VLEYIEAHPEFIQPDFRRNQVLSGLRDGVADLSISRATLKWGIPLPNDPSHVLYVWIDALSNYITALGYPDDPAPKFWPADLHLIGKEILWFHAVYWPAMLFALGLPQPRKLYAHGWWVADGKKMSKTMGNFIDIPHLDKLAATYSQDAVRYYLLRAAPFGADLDFSEADFRKNFEELAKIPGNCLNRVIKMVGNYCGGVIPPADITEDADRAVQAEIEALPARLAAAFDAVELQKAASVGVDLARTVNGYIESTAPFKLKDPSQQARRAALLGLQARAMAVVFAALLPIVPGKAAEGLKQLGIDPAGKTLDDLFKAAHALAGNKVGDPIALFPQPPIEKK
jgi:methionyl-tRNA synthetase